MSAASKPGFPRRGVWLYPGAPAPALADAVVAADELGLDEIWIADEGVAREPMMVLAAAAGRTTRIDLAVGITSPLLRHPGAIAATAATLDELSDGRAILGLGVGGRESLGPFALSSDRPVSLLRNAVRVARAVLEGSSVEGYTAPTHAMPARHVPIWVGARGPQLTRTAARDADGLFLSGCTPQQHERIIGDVRAIDPLVPLALYQSASDRDRRESVLTWAEVGEHLEVEAARLAPTSVGINLIDLIASGHDPVGLVERAAAILLALG